MGCVVAEYAQGVKEVGYLRRQNTLETQAAEQIGLGFIARFIKTCLRRDELGEQFGELAKLNKACVGVVVEVSFGKRSQPHELNVMRFKKAEIAGLEPAFMVQSKANLLYPKTSNTKVKIYRLPTHYSGHAAAEHCA